MSVTDRWSRGESRGDPCPDGVTDKWIIARFEERQRILREKRKRAADYLAAATHLFRTHPHPRPDLLWFVRKNALVCRLIFEKLGQAYGLDIAGAIAKGKEQASRL
jgi:hypothetical protein